MMKLSQREVFFYRTNMYSLKNLKEIYLRKGSQRDDGLKESQ